MEERIDECQICGGKDFSVFLTGKDYFLTGEQFTIDQCRSCGFRFTNPRPVGKEMEKYYKSENYISHDTQKLDLTTILYRSARYFSIRSKFNIIDSNASGKWLLDIGCGTGEVLHYASVKSYHARGVEMNEKARKFATEKYQLKVFGSISELPAAEMKFDVITLWHVLEHIYDLKEILKNFHALLNPSGVLIIALPNSDSWDAGHYKEFWAAYDLPRHLSHFTKPTLELLMERNGFEIQQIIPQKLDAYYISLLSEQYLRGRKNFPRALLNGLKANFISRNEPTFHSSLIYLVRPKIS